ncbi:MAG: helix-turn-helix domain-containing protein, partial [Chloroflexota bacterium]|nr:helix-turn-helix domain-containing protein [Chloroflexota bacterium]
MKAVSFGQWLKQARKALDMTQADLAEHAGCSQRTIAKLEAGERKPSKQLAELLAQALEIPADAQFQFVRYARSGSGPAAWKLPEPEAPPARVELPGSNGNSAASLTSTPNNLPAPPTEFIGREKQIVEAAALLRRPYVRLLTLTGTGGVGKTRLAIEVARELVDGLSDGVFFVPLAPLTDPALVVQTVAQTLGVEEARGRPLFEVLKSYLRDKNMLLLLDNFEQVLEAAPLMAELLSAGAGLKMLVTSREMLHLRGEKEIEVPPLALPASLDSTSPEELAGYEAVRLFVDRAGDAKHGFVLSSGNALVVAEVCARLEGLPLAIELVAARVKSLPLHALLEGLSSRLAMATGPLVDLPARQRTLRDTIAWSYNLLSVDEQRLFRRLAVFAGGSSLEAVDQVCSFNLESEAQERQEGEETTLRRLESLVDRHLLQYVLGSRQGEGPRFEMLETIREYAWEQLRESGEDEALRRAHAEYFGSLTEQARRELYGPGQGSWFDRLEMEHDNLRAALDWSHAAGADADLGLPIAATLGWFWEVRAYYSEGRERLTRILSTTEDSTPNTARARALCAAARLEVMLKDFTAAKRLAEESLRFSLALGNRSCMAQALY